MIRALISGALLALSATPDGRWYLVPLALALLMRAIDKVGWRSRMRRGWVTGFVMFAFSLAWTRQFSLPGWVVLATCEALFFAFAAALTPLRKPSVTRHALCFIATLTVAELIRIRFPLGGTPLGGFTVSAAAGPLAHAAGVVGEAGLVTIFATLAVALNELRRWHGARRRLILLPIILLLSTTALSHIDKTRATGVLHVTTVQAGGPQGLRIDQQQPAHVFLTHYELTKKLGKPGGVVIWPEDIIDIAEPIAESQIGLAMSKLANETRAYLGAGVVEREGTDHFRNAYVVWGPEGRIVSRYEKFKRVPFGEYVPGRALVNRFADLSQIPRDAIRGEGSSTVQAGEARAAIAVSFEGMFAQRVRSGVREGGEVVLIPTNAASYKSTRVARLQLQAARLRAIESGRAVVQSAPTGISAIIDAKGNVIERSAVGSEYVIERDITLRHGESFFTRWGDAPLAIISIAILVSRWVRRFARRERARDPAGDARRESC